MNLFELFVKIGVDDQASGTISKITSGLGKGLATAAKIGTAAVGAAAAGITALTKAAVDNYAEYEQLIGGVETLYGAKYKTIEEYIEGTGAAAEYAEQTFAEYQKRQQAVLDNAANAYKTAGMSANEYMNTVNGFAASLTSSLGEYEWQAANYADMIVSDMADNANKMGTNMEMIQNAYAGFAKQNYTMLDNLKLGYGGTKTEMERLLRDAERMAGYIEGSLDIESFADIADAIHIVQEEMGITGTTALEAGRTISGSVGAMKSAWTNLVTGFADGSADIGGLIDNLVTTIVGDGTENNLGVIGNVLPAIERALGGIAKLIEGAAPKIIEILPGLVDRVVPSVISAATGMVDAVTKVLPDLLNTVVDALIQNAPALITAAVGLVQSLIQGIQDNYQILVDGAIQIVTQLATGILNMLPQIVQLGLDLLVSLANGITESLPVLIPTIVDVILQIVDTLTDPAQLTLILNAGLELLLGLVQGLVDAVPSLIDAAFTIIDNLVQFILDPENLTAVIEASLEIIMKIAEGLIQAIPQLAEAAVQIIVKLCEFILDPENIGMLIDMCFDLIIVISEGLLNAAVELVKAAGTLIEQLIDVFKKTDWDAVGQSIVDSISNGYQKSWDVSSDWVSGAWDDIVEAIETTDWEGVGSSIVDFLWNGYQNFWGGFFEWVSNTWDELVDMFESPDWNGLGSSVVDGILGGIQGSWDSLVSWVSNAWNNLIGGLGSIFGVETPASSLEDKLSKASSAVKNQTYSSGMSGKMSVATATASGKAGKGGAGVTIVQNIHAVPQTPAELASATSAYFEQARWTR